MNKNEATQHLQALFYGDKSDWYEMVGDTKDWSKSAEKVEEFWNSIRERKMMKEDFDFEEFVFPAVANNTFWEKDQENSFSGEVSFNGAQFLDFTSFDEARFSGKADFSLVQFLGGADFNEVQFSDVADFSLVQFSSYANFRHAIFLGDVDFHSAQFSYTAFFNRVQFSGNASFSRAQFSGYANFLHTQFSGEVDFHSARFWYTSFFKKTQFSGQVSFSQAQFSGQVSFSRTQFSDDASFLEVQFSAETSFPSAEFSGQANFTAAKFSGQANFAAAQFLSHASFLEAKISDNAVFSEAQFSGVAYFSVTQFLGDVSFLQAKFWGHVSFSETQFLGDSDFSEAQFSGEIEFTYTVFERANFERTRFPHERRTLFEELNISHRVRFKDVIFSDNIQFQRCRMGQIAFYSCDFVNVNFSNCIFKKNWIGRLVMGNDGFKGMSDQDEMYRQLKRNRMDAKDWGNAGDAYRSEMTMKLRLMGLSIIRGRLDRLFNCLIISGHGLLSAYQQSMTRPLIWLSVLLTLVPYKLYEACPDQGIFIAWKTSIDAALPIVGKIDIGVYDHQFYFLLVAERVLAITLLTFFGLATRSRLRQ